MSLNVGQLFATLSLDQAHFQKGLGSAKADFKALGTNLAQSVSGMGPAGSALSGISTSLAGVGGSAAAVGLGVTAAVAGIVAIGAAAFRASADLGEMAEKLSNMSETTGLSKTTLQELKFVAENAGLSFEAMTNASSMVQRKLMGVEEDSGTAAKVFDRLGISTKDASGQLKSMDNLFPEMIRKFQGMTNTTERNMLASQVFGRSLGEIAPLLGMTAAQMQEATKRAHELGLVMSDKDLLKAQQLDDSIDDIKQQFKGMWMSFATAMLPYVKPAVEWFQKTMSDAWPKIKKAMSDWWKEVKPIFTELYNVFKELWPLISPLLKIGIMAGGLIEKFKANVLIAALRLIKWILMGIAFVIEDMMDSLKEWMDLWKESVNGPETMIETAVKAAINYAKLMGRMQAASKEHMREAVAAAKELAAGEVEAVMDVLKKTKELHAAENARKRDAIGWGAIGDVWKNNMVASLQMQFPTPGPNAKDLRESDVPPPRELQGILQELRTNNRKADELKKLISDRLGVYV